MDEQKKLNARIGKNIAKVRSGQGLSITNLSEETNFSVQNIWRWENGQRTIKATDITTLSLALGVSADELLLYGVAVDLANDAEMRTLASKLKKSSDISTKQIQKMVEIQKSADFDDSIAAIPVVDLNYFQSFVNDVIIDDFLEIEEHAEPAGCDADGSISEIQVHRTIYGIGMHRGRLFRTEKSHEDEEGEIVDPDMNSPAYAQKEFYYPDLDFCYVPKGWLDEEILQNSRDSYPFLAADIGTYLKGNLDYPSGSKVIFHTECSRISDGDLIICSYQDMEKTEDAQFFLRRIFFEPGNRISLSGADPRTKYTLLDEKEQAKMDFIILGKVQFTLSVPPKGSFQTRN